ncbi:Acrosin [Platysternon megacephalum]|uniref:Acrosin n=1 Tax=Platysternon megacephalum TaxID=55544 RepID=A0A4D9DNY2_9SAUR|nr:Acrosin [Platysternon megacephalum]
MNRYSNPLPSGQPLLSTGGHPGTLYPELWCPASASLGRPNLAPLRYTKAGSVLSKSSPWHSGAVFSDQNESMQVAPWKWPAREINHNGNRSGDLPQQKSVQQTSHSWICIDLPDSYFALLVVPSSTHPVRLSPPRPSPWVCTQRTVHSVAFSPC